MTQDPVEIVWDTVHAPDCEVTRSRADLLEKLQRDPENVYLRGAVPEYHGGGDQEVAICDCGIVDARYDESAAREP